MDELYIGLMSGTSLNGVDAVVLAFSNATPRLLHSHSEAFPASLYTDLQQLVTTQQTSLSKFAAIDHQLAVVYSLAVKKLLHNANLLPTQIHAIGCHGQTVYHQPDGEHRNTLQLGDPSFIAEATGIRVVADFRRRDMAAGGQGAPLVPAFHAASFRVPTQHRVILNIGGIANITILPAIDTGEVTGFDTGPGNTLLDQWAGRHRNQAYDRNGEWAGTGKVNESLLQTLLNDRYFTRMPPKSTGREYFNLDWLETHLNPAYRAEDVQASLLELTCQSIARDILRYASKTTEVFVCGGGAHNSVLMKRLAQILDPIRVETTAVLGIDVEWVEAAAFAWLARQSMHQQAGNLPGVTGATHPVVLGGIFPGTN